MRLRIRQKFRSTYCRRFKGLYRGAKPQIFANRCAPLQINFLGYPGSLGAEYIDYMVADATIIPGDLRKITQRKLYCA